MKSEDKAMSGRAARSRSMSAAVIVDAVAAIHRREHAIGARLHRQMQERHQLRHIAMRRDQLVIHIARMRGRVTQPLQPRQLGKRADEPAETPFGAVTAASP